MVHTVSVGLMASSRDDSRDRNGPPRRTDLAIILFVMCAIAIACVAYLADSLLST
jgi:hypothetical protein